jgi:hypothetical protein
LHVAVVKSAIVMQHRVMRLIFITIERCIIDEQNFIEIQLNSQYHVNVEIQQCAIKIEIEDSRKPSDYRGYGKNNPERLWRLKHSNNTKVYSVREM